MNRFTFIGIVAAINTLLSLKSFGDDKYPWIRMQVDYEEHTNLAAVARYGGGVLDKMDISHISSNMKSVENIEYLSMVECNIKIFRDHEAFFKRLKSIKYLVVSNNRGEVELVEFVNYMPSLQALNISGNNVSISESERPVAKLKMLDLGACGLESAEGVSRFDSLTHLFLLKNKISDIRPLLGMPNLEYLSLERNSITIIPPIPKISGLRELYIWGNPVHSTTNWAHAASIIMDGPVR